MFRCDGIIRERENRLGPSLVRPGRDARGFGGPAGDQSDRGEQHGFAGTGLTGDGGHACGRRNGGFSNRPRLRISSSSSIRILPCRHVRPACRARYQRRQRHRQRQRQPHTRPPGTCARDAATGSRPRCARARANRPRQIELGDQTVGERHAGESGEAQGIARFAHHDARTLRQGALTASIAANPAFGHGIVQNIDGEGRAGADDQRPGEQACAANGINCRALTFGHMTGPPAEKA